MKPISRRKLLFRLTATGLIAAGLPSLTKAEESPNRESEGRKKLKIIVTGGHPGDPEYGCGGTIARFSEKNAEVALLYLNAGEPEGTPENRRGIRTAEASKACEILKARPLFAGQTDGSAIIDAPHYEQFRRQLRAEKPDIVFTHWPIDNHADHRAISMLVYDAWLNMGKSFALYYYEVSNGEDTLQFHPDCYVDISPVIETKRRACFAHASQSPEKFYSLQQKVAEFRGLESGHKQAEAFLRHVQSPQYALP